MNAGKWLLIKNTNNKDIIILKGKYMKVRYCPNCKKVPKIYLNESNKVGFEKSKLELKDAVGLELVDDVLKSYANSLNVRVNTEAIKRAFSVYTNEQE